MTKVYTDHGIAHTSPLPSTRTVCQAAGTKASGPPRARISASLNQRRLSSAAKVGAQVEPTCETSPPLPSMAVINRVCQARSHGRRATLTFTFLSA